MNCGPIKFKTATAAKKAVRKATKIADELRTRFIDAWKAYYAATNELDAINEAARRVGVEPLDVT